MCVCFTLNLSTLPNGGGEGGGEGAGSSIGGTDTPMMTTIREGVAPWTTVPVVADNEQAVQSTTIFSNLGLDGGAQGERLRNGTDSKSAAVRETAEVTAGKQVNPSGSGTTTTSEADVHNNLYYPLYYGEAHIEVGHPFAITCILTRTEAVQWQRDGKVIQVQGRRKKRAVLQRRRTGREEAEIWKEETFPMPMKNQINWDIDERPMPMTRTLSGDIAGAQGRHRNGWMDWVGGFQQFQEEEEEEEEEQMENRRKRQIGAESVSSDDDEEETLEWEGFADAGQEIDDNDDDGKEVSAAAAGDGHLARRLKRNVSELEQFKLRQYYNALVYYKNQPGGGGYYMDSFLKRDEQTRRVGEDEEEMEVTEVEDEEKSIHDYVFTQGQVQVVVHLHHQHQHQCLCVLPSSRLDKRSEAEKKISFSLSISKSNSKWIITRNFIQINDHRKRNSKTVLYSIDYETTKLALKRPDDL